jgi:O-antigen/teichoic acid export membrane protein
MSQTPATFDGKLPEVAEAHSPGQLGKQFKTVRGNSLWHVLHAATPFGSNVALTIGGNVLLGILALITGPLCARLLGPAGRGELAAIQNLYWLIATLAMLGLPEATLYFTARRATDARRILSSSITFCLLTFPVFYAAVYFFIPTFLAAQSSNVVSTARWVLLGMPLYSLSTIPQYSLRADNDLLWWNITRTLPTIGWVILLIILAVVAKPSSTVFAFAYLGIFAVALIPTLVVTSKRVLGSYRPKPGLWPGMLKYGIPIGGSAIPIILNLRLDQMIMAAFVPARLLGLYVVAVAWSATVPPVLLAIGSALFPRIAGANDTLRVRYLAQGTRIGMAAGAVLAIIIAMFTPFAVPLLFGSAFQESVAVSVVLVFAAAISGMNIIFEEGFRGLGDTPAVFWSELAGLAVTAILLAILLRPLGIMGAGIASVLGYSTTFCYLTFRACRRTDLLLKDMLLLTNEDVRLIWTKLLVLRSSVRIRTE